MFYNFNGNRINITEIIAIEQFDSGGKDYPFGLRVRLRSNGLNYGVRYTRIASFTA